MSLTMKSNTMGVINVSSRDEFLKELTLHRCMASVPYGSRYRLVDFMLSNMVNSGINNVAIFTLNKYRSLMDHLGSGKSWDLDRKKDGLFVLPPASHYPQGEYKGLLQILQDHLDYFHQSKEKHVIISESNMVCNLNFNPAIEFHREKRADISVFYREENGVTPGLANRRRLETNQDGRIKEFELEPGSLESRKALLKLFIINKSCLLDLIDQSIQNQRYSFLWDGIINNVDQLNIFGFPHQGYLAVVNSIDCYYLHSMDLLDPQIWQELFFQPGLIYTKVKDEPPTRYMKEGQVINSLLANGCLVEGKVENSILFRGVKVRRGAHIKDSIIMQKSLIEENARVSRAVIDKDVRVTQGRQIHGEENKPVVIAKKMVV